MLAGRSSEQTLLDRWQQEADTGLPRFALIRGEPGIGKSRLLRHWTAKMRESGTRVLVGSAFENVSTPFLPIATAVDALPGMSDLFVNPAGELDTGNAEMRVHLKVAGALLRAATHRPLVLAIDDLHWADRGTLGFLYNLVATLSQPSNGLPPRMLIVATCRAAVVDPDVDAAIGRLAREPIVRPLRLPGLDEIEMHEMLTARCGGVPSPVFLAAVLDATSGNPLLAELIVEELEMRGLIEVRDGHVNADTDTIRLVVSAELGQACAPRLGRVRPAAREVLEVAALVGDGGSLDDLAAITERDHEELLTVLVEAEDAAVAAAEGEIYRFHHPLLRSVLVGSMPGYRRQAVERRIVDGLLNRYGTGDDRVALSIIEHARRSRHPLPSGDMAKLLEAAGRYAASLGAWATAADCYEQLLDTMDDATEPARRASIELSAGMAHRHNADYLAAHPHLLRSVDMASRSEDVGTWGEALFWLTNSQVLERVPDAQVDPAMIDAFLDRAGDAVPDAQVRVLANVAQFHFGQFDLASAMPVLVQAKDLARDAMQAGTHHFVATVEGLHHLGRLDLPQAEDCFRRAIALSADHEDPWQAEFVEVGLPLVDVLAGELSRAATRAAAAARSAIATHQWNLHGLATACGGAAAVGQGRVVDGERHAAAALQSFRRSDYYWAAVVGVPNLAAARALRGDRLGALQALEAWTDREDRQTARDVLRVEMLCGERERVAVVADQARLLPLDPTPMVFSLNRALLAVEAGDQLDDLDLLQAGYDHLVSVPQPAAFGVAPCMSVRRVLGLGAFRLGDMDAAGAWLDGAERDAARAASPAETARIAVVRARLMAQAGEDGDVIRGALRPALEYTSDARLVALAAEVQRAWPGHRPDFRPDLVVLYTDLVGSTELNVRAGDDMYLDLLREHNKIVRRRLAAFGGLEFTFTGDGVGASFASVDRAVAFALGLQDDFDDANDAHPEFPLQVRIGLARGDALENEGNLFGQTVVRAVRVCAAAGAGEVMVDEDVPEVVDPSIARFAPTGRVHLKGFGHAELHRARSPVAADY
jgi:class 3 adenylate cyclase/tetratricopeptide (TPR) repeat protein